MSLTAKLAKFRGRKGFSLIEVTLALGVVGFCMVPLFGLLPIGLTSSQDSLEQTVSANVATAILSDLKGPPQPGTTLSSRFGFNLPAPSGTVAAQGAPQTIYLSADGSATGAVGSTPVYNGKLPPRYRATVWFTPPASGQRNTTAVRLLVTWPALADPKPAATPSNYVGHYEADTTLDCN